MKKELDTLLQKRMDRRDFLKHVAIGFIALTGMTTLVKTLSTVSSPTEQTVGYGASVYGGNRTNSSER